MISPIFNASDWTEIDLGFQDITFHKAKDTGAVRIAFNRPDVRNAFRPQTVDELLHALEWAHRANDVGVILLTGNGPSSKDGGWAFCSGGDQRVRGKQGYEYKEEAKSNMLSISFKEGLASMSRSLSKGST
jgi:naphthoate synthase